MLAQEEGLMAAILAKGCYGLGKVFLEGPCVKDLVPSPWCY